MAITRDGQREAQRRYEPTFRRADEMLCRVVAALWGGLPTSGYRVIYEAIPPTVAELREMQMYVDGEIAAGRMTRLQAYMALHPEMDERDAQRVLEAIDAAMSDDEPDEPDDDMMDDNTEDDDPNEEDTDE